MVASRRIFIVSSSHPYHNCKIPFLYGHVMTQFMTLRRRRYLFLLSISSTRIYLAYRLCTNHVCPPFAFRINQGRPVPVTTARPRSPLLANPSKPFDKPKVLYHQVTFRHRYTVGPFDCTLYIMYYQTCRFCLICNNTSYVTPDFHTIPTPGPVSYSS